MNATQPVYQYFTLREWKIINQALNDLRYVYSPLSVDDKIVVLEEIDYLMTKLPSASFPV